MRHVAGAQQGWGCAWQPIRGALWLPRLWEGDLSTEWLWGKWESCAGWSGAGWAPQAEGWVLGVAPGEPQLGAGGCSAALLGGGIPGCAPPWCQVWGCHGWMLLGSVCLPAMGRMDPTAVCSGRAVLPWQLFRAGPSYGNQGAKQETARLPPGNFSREPGPSRQGISPSPSSTLCLPK